MKFKGIVATPDHKLLAEYGPARPDKNGVLHYDLYDMNELAEKIIEIAYYLHREKEIALDDTVSMPLVEFYENAKNNDPAEKHGQKSACGFVREFLIDIGFIHKKSDEAILGFMLFENVERLVLEGEKSLADFPEPDIAENKSIAEKFLENSYGDYFDFHNGRWAFEDQRVFGWTNTKVKLDSRAAILRGYMSGLAELEKSVLTDYPKENTYRFN